MNTYRPAAALAATALSTSIMVTGAAPAAAEAPPPTWDPTGVRNLTCDGVNLTAHWSRGGALTVLLVEGGTDVIVPKRVSVVIPPATTPVPTLAVPGFDANAVDTVHCTFTDPAGYFIELWGVRT